MGLWVTVPTETVHEVCTNPCVFITLGLALSKKQIPQIVENIGNQNSGRSYWRGLRFFASRGSPVRSRSRPPTEFRSPNHLRCFFCCTILVQFQDDSALKSYSLGSAGSKHLIHLIGGPTQC